MRTRTNKSLRTKTFSLVSLAFLLYLFPPCVFALSFDCKSPLEKKLESKILDQIQDRYQQIKTVSADFVQEAYSFALDTSQSSRGHVYMKTPGRMEWLYQHPEEQRFVTDGEVLWFYQAAENQVTIANFESSFQSDLPVSFLLGLGDLKKQFKLEHSCKTVRGILIRLSPKSADRGLEAFHLLVREKDFTPIGAGISDIGQNQTRISLLNVVINSRVEDERFTFHIPRGVDIIDRRTFAEHRDSAEVKETDLVRGEARTEAVDPTDSKKSLEGSEDHVARSPADS